ncbi:allatostatin-A receptor-like [Glandiceps talaboti]
MDVILVTTIMPIVLSIGLIGNGLIVYVFARVREMQTVTNYFLVNLAVADMLFLFLAVPPKLVQYYSSPLPLLGDVSALGDWGCTIISFPSAVAITVSTMTIILLALEKYMAVKWPYRFKTMHTKPKAIVACIAVWITAAIYCFPEVYVLRIQVYQIDFPAHWNNTWTPSELHMCIPSCTPYEGQCESYNTYYIFDRVVFIMVVPILTILYILTLYHLHDRVGIGSSSASVRAKKQLVRLLIVTTLIYLVCVTPFRFLTLLQTLNIVKIAPDTTSTTLLHISRVMMYINCAINPAIYNVLNDQYRKAFRETLFCQLDKLPPSLGMRTTKT